MGGDIKFMVNDIISAVNDFVWGPIMLALLVGTGVFLTVRLKFLPWRNLGYALKSVFKRSEKKEGSDDGEGDISPFQSLISREPCSQPYRLEPLAKDSSQPERRGNIQGDLSERRNLERGTPSCLLFQARSLRP